MKYLFLFLAAALLAPALAQEEPHLKQPWASSLGVALSWTNQSKFDYVLVRRLKNGQINKVFKVLPQQTGRYGIAATGETGCCWLDTNALGADFVYQIKLFHGGTNTSWSNTQRVRGVQADPSSRIKWLLPRHLRSAEVFNR